MKLQFYGFDSPTDVITDSPRQTLHVTLDYLSSVDEILGQEYRKRIDPLLGQDAAWENPAAALDPTQAIGRSPEATALRIETEELMAELRVRRPELVAKSDESRYLEAVHYAVVARQLLHYHAALVQPSAKRQARLLGIRDAMSAVGSSPANEIGQPEAGTLEARFTSSPGPVRFISTHQGLPAEEIAALPIRSGSKKNRSYEPLGAQSFTDFDWFAFLDTTTYNGWGHF
jgi:hypothetical protein